MSLTVDEDRCKVAQIRARSSAKQTSFHGFGMLHDSINESYMHAARAAASRRVLFSYGLHRYIRPACTNAHPVTLPVKQSAVVKTKFY